MQKWFGELNITLYSEHGHFKKDPKNDWIEKSQGNNRWKENFLPIFQDRASKTKELGDIVKRIDKGFLIHSVLQSRKRHKNGKNVTDPPPPETLICNQHPLQSILSITNVTFCLPIFWQFRLFPEF